MPTVPEGTLSGLYLYPLKSGRASSMPSARVELDGLLGDRAMMVVDASGVGLTSRDLPRLLQIAVHQDGGAVVLLADGMAPLELDPQQRKPAQGLIWGAGVSGFDGGAAAATWLSDFLDRDVRLLIKDRAALRPSDLVPVSPVTLADTAPLLLIGTASLAELNRYLPLPVPMSRFRPNLVISTSEPFIEDGWGVLRIGEQLFDLAGPCDRCIVTTLDAATGRREGSEPLATLARRRRGEDGKAYFGQFAVPRAPGRISVGDRVHVETRKIPLRLVPPPPERPRLVLPDPLPAGSAGDFALTCIGITQETPDLKTFRFRPERALHYLPGQFITLKPVIAGKQVARSYTISSTPSRPGHVSVSVKRVEGGLVSNWLHDTMVVGMSLQAGGPSGQFHLGRAEAGRGLLLISAGSGVTPMMSMLRYIVDHAMPLDVHYHHTCRTRRDMAFLDELVQLQHAAAGRARVTFNITSESDPVADQVVSTAGGRLNREMLDQLVPDWQQRSIFCCGADGYRNALLDLMGLGPKPDNYFEERFGSAPDLAATLPPIGPYAVTFHPSGARIEGSGTTTLLGLAREAGLSIRTDCEAGICGSCRCLLRKGQWQSSPNCADPDRSVLSDDEKQQGVVLACSTSPIGAVEVDLI